MDRPLLLIDIDGVISLFGFDALHPPAGRFLMVDGIVHFLSATAGELLEQLAERFELVWCSGWEEKADEYLPLALGLPAGLPHLTFDGPRGQTDRHWKLAAIDRHAPASRALAWIDDAFDDSCHTWCSARSGPTKLVLTEPAVGLTAELTSALLGWAATLPSGDADHRSQCER
jgi:hypothetical protein